MLKKVFVVIFSLLFLVGCTSEGEHSNTSSSNSNESYKYGDKVNIKLNDVETKEGYVIEEKGNELVVLLDNISTMVNYVDLENQLKKSKNEWKNVSSVDLLDVEVAFKHLNVEMNDTMDGYAIYADDENKFLIGSTTYWISNGDNHKLYCHSGDGNLNNCTWAITVYELSFYGKNDFKMGFRPTVTINKKFISNNKQENNGKEYKLFDSVKLKDGNSWIVLEDMKDTVLLVESKKSALVYSSDINKKLDEHKSELIRILNNYNANTAGLEMRLLTTSDMLKYFGMDFDNKENAAYSKKLTNTELNKIKDWEYSSFWIKNDSVSKSPDYLVCKSIDGKLRCYTNGDEIDEKWHNLAVIKISKDSLIK